MDGDNIQTYVSMAAGLTRATREKARSAARGLLAQTGLDDVAAETTGRVSRLAEEIIEASRANRELMQKLVLAEMDRAASRLGFARSEEVDALRQELAELRLGLAHQAARTGEAATPAPSAPTVVDPVVTAPVPTPPARKSPAKRAPAKKTPAKTTPAKNVPAATKSPATKSPARKAPAKKAPAKKAPAKKAPAKKSPAKKAPAKKAQATKSVSARTATSTTPANAPGAADS